MRELFADAIRSYSPDIATFMPLPISAGERTVPGIWHENYWFRRHEVVYDWTVTLVEQVTARLGRDPVVVDAGCGEGYGTQALAARSPTLALDYDAATATHLARAHPGDELYPGALVDQGGSQGPRVGLEIARPAFRGNLSENRPGRLSLLSRRRVSDRF